MVRVIGAIRLSILLLSLPSQLFDLFKLVNKLKVEIKNLSYSNFDLQLKA